MRTPIDQRLKKGAAVALLFMGPITIVWAFFEIPYKIFSAWHGDNQGVFQEQVIECRSPDDCMDKAYRLGQAYRMNDARVRAHLFAEEGNLDSSGAGFCTVAFKGDGYDKCTYSKEIIRRSCGRMISFVFWRGNDFVHEKLPRCGSPVAVVGSVKAVRGPLIKGWMILVAIGAMAVSLIAYRMLAMQKNASETKPGK